MVDIQMLELVPDLPELDFDYSDLLETFQLLNDFGYIQNKDFIKFNKTKNKQQFLANLLPSPVKKFRIEYRLLLQMRIDSINKLAISSDLNDNILAANGNILISEEIVFLSELSSIDGDIHFEEKQLPAKGSISLLSRIIHYRLKILGLFDESVDLPYGNYAFVNALDLLKNWLKLEHEYEIISLTGDIVQLGMRARKFKNRTKTLFEGVAYFKYQREKQERRKYKPNDLITGPGKEFITQLENSLASSRFKRFHLEVVSGIVKKYNIRIQKSKTEIRRLKEKIYRTKKLLSDPKMKDRTESLEKKISRLQKKKESNELFITELSEPSFRKPTQCSETRDYTYVDRIINDQFNHFIIRLLQVIQWSGGLYPGKLDNVIGDLTFDSIFNLVELVNTIRPENNLTLDKVLIFIGDGRWALNIYYFLDNLVVKNEMNQESNYSFGDIYDQLYDEDPKLNDYTLEERRKYISGRNQTRRDFEEELNNYSTKLENDTTEGRKLYKGFKRILGFFRRIGKWATTAIGKIINFFKKLWRVIKSSISTIFKEIKEAFRKFGKGIKLLFGKRNIQTPESGKPSIITDMDFDFDLVTFVNGISEYQVFEKHIKKCYEYAKGLEFTLTLVGKGISIALSISPFGWVNLGLKLISLVKDSILRKRRATESLGPDWTHYDNFANRYSVNYL